MDSKNVLMAVVLSAIVLIGWGTFFEPPQVKKQNENNQTTENDKNSSPSIEGELSKKKMFEYISIIYSAKNYFWALFRKLFIAITVILYRGI